MSGGRVCRVGSDSSSISSRSSSSSISSSSSSRSGGGSVGNTSTRGGGGGSGRIGRNLRGLVGAFVMKPKESLVGVTPSGWDSEESRLQKAVGNLEWVKHRMRRGCT